MLIVKLLLEADDECGKTMIKEVYTTHECKNDPIVMENLLLKT